ncbi:MAG: hypothetical protein ABSH30_18190 [Acidimicrobiales bacterium]
MLDARQGESEAEEGDSGDNETSGAPGRHRLAIAAGVAVAAAVLAAAYFGASATASPSTGSQLTSAWNGLTAAMAPPIKSAAELSHQAVVLERFANAVERIRFPAGAEDRAHDVIRVSLALASDVKAATFVPATPSCVGLECGPGSGAEPAAVSSVVNLQTEEALLERDVGQLFAVLGVHAPG